MVVSEEYDIKPANSSCSNQINKNFFYLKNLYTP